MDIQMQLDPSRIRPIDLPLLAGDNSRLLSEGFNANEYTLEDTVTYILKKR